MVRDAVYTNLTDGTSVRLGYGYGISFVIDPLSGIDVTLATSQGYEQIGQSVIGQSVQGISRTIDGRINLPEQSESLLQKIRSVFRPLTRGRLEIDGVLYADAVVKKSPIVMINPGTGEATFSLMLFFPSPFWYAVDAVGYQLGGYEAAFRFPVLYDSHTFGVRIADAFTRLENTGDAVCDYRIEFRCTSPVTGYGVQDVQSLDFVRLDDTLAVGDVVVVTRKEGRMSAVKIRDNVVTDIFPALDEESEFLSIPVGETTVRLIADSGLNTLEGAISFSPARSAVL